MYQITIDETENEKAKKIIQEGLFDASKKTLGSTDFAETSFSVLLKDEEGAVVGGLLARYDLESIYVDMLWVKESLRHQGYGSQLLRAAEKEAARLQCRYSTLDTYSFEAVDFYLKNGYALLGEVKNYWLHHSKVFLRKIVMP